MSKHLFKTLCLLVLIAMLAVAPDASAGPQATMVVVVARGAEVTTLSKDDLKRAFLGENVTAAGKKLVPFNFNPGTPERSGFDRVVLGMSPDEAGRFWIDHKVRGQAPAPRALPSAVHMVKVIAKFPAAIGYLPEALVTPDLQVVKIDGAAQIKSD
jgi:hypothetical protein